MVDHGGATDGIGPLLFAILLAILFPRMARALFVAIVVLGTIVFVAILASPP